MREGSDVILYDGVCGFCNAMNRFVIARDVQRRFRFASLQSRFAAALLARHGRDASALDTFFVVVDEGGPGERLLARSAAALHLLSRLGGPWRLSRLLGLLPARLLDAVYEGVARNRYRLFGRHEVCPVPRPEDRARFIEV
jgi:predicted DCC family thiol-disulfide oxidoreductase YuxK